MLGWAGRKLHEGWWWSGVWAHACIHALAHVDSKCPYMYWSTMLEVITPHVTVHRTLHARTHTC